MNGLCHRFNRGLQFAGKRINRRGWFLAHRDKGLKIGANSFDALAGDKGQQIQPVRTNVGDGTHHATQIRLQPPVPIAGQQEPVLQIRTLHDVDIA